MKKVMIERLANLIRRAPKNVSVKRKRKRLSFEIKAPAYQLHTLNLSDYGDGSLSFILEKEADGNLFVVAKSPETYGPDKGAMTSLFRAQVASETDGVYMITQVNSLLTKKFSILKLVGVALLAWLGYLFVSAYIDIVSGKGRDIEPSALSSLDAVRPAVPVAQPRAPIPMTVHPVEESIPAHLQAAPVADAAQLQAMSPDDIAKQIYNAAEAARKQGMRDNAPAMSSDVATGLESFGLAPSIDAGQSVGPGCDPKLAFQVAE
ncbi:TPA: hypothetical protein ACRNLW_005057 [Pseudomonas aeruginosa]|uniref:hypothetical protein n=1 Tax=Pseudomonas aeruginosa TaxID=287 RepID=UPI0005F10321|nr:hypothetical protein [Pseudomonas aeruginosa]KJS29231.1 MAG: hypothetical protein VR76_06645 [Pseudomonas sp. BRH_c35]MBH8731493.1 hypothetical protein [Pseudomonas aeruginosa]MCS8383219.1 hypothetical protein [Pseudomonas aeruginosa]MCS8456827.1 hypothetical protein [Pseudomonas aeruginosa]MCS9277084.1 hypothetical protein [Pseudomonas aeruginosa]